ncbi:HU family DNA-binding protein [Candidatus Uhrbacteria bacterium]|nr:HU family DNA-binding protein [Candidatus Uhrbacteria bacterium]
MKMTKTQIVAAMAEKMGMSKKDTSAFMNALHEMAVKEVKKNGEFIVGDFGKLIKAKRAARMGRNPQTGATIKIPAKTVVKFRLSKPTKEALV